MGFSSINLQSTYDSDEDDVLNDFYIPVLTQSVFYRRLAGFFSSSALAIAAKGIGGLIRNGGKMELVVGAKLRKADIDAITKAVEHRDAIITAMMIKDLDKLETEFIRDHVRALGWMVANNRLEIKVAIPLSVNEEQNGACNEGLFHQKVGILFDNTETQNIISFSGSVNESEMGWRHSIEEFKVFRSWIQGEKDYLKADLEKFNKYWNGLAKRAIVVDVPTAVYQKLIEIAPEDFDELHLERFYKPIRKLWPHQSKAIQAWITNKYRGIFAMATGTGKTFAALSASSLAPKSVITIILVPTIPILRQWAEKDIPAFDRSAEIICCSSGFKWREVLLSKLSEIRKLKEEWLPSNRLYVISTMKTASSHGFLLYWKGLSENNIQIIVDEVHHIGAPTYQRCTEMPSSRRLGLSATPERYWDPEGTLATIDYIGSTVYEYSLKEAIADGRLSHYLYYPFFAFLDNNEFEEFFKLSEQIKKESARQGLKKKKNTDIEIEPEKKYGYQTKRLQRLCEQRAKIKKKAKDKIRVFEEILDETSSFPIIVFCEDDEQLIDIRKTLDKKVLSYGIYTSKRADNWQRKKVLEDFRNKELDVLLAIRCLDEGLDVPECSGCIIVASSSNTREFVQRRGRILRWQKGKIAALNDILVMPPKSKSPDDKVVAEKLLRQELERMKQLIEAADNWADVRNQISNQLTPYGLEGLAYI